ncbi:Lysophospholipase L1 [Pseudobutyrivibrio sp. UC1225]|uniref:GDSL-type esterase/lipase family protein n=1 Tax=Pseudobutyrivibrio sp. UC1225 TaxID=1798185 RepID=UPI0008E0D086|nr:GDSL-type esterase/lipase family protein [Pseudobutyrivibrio sp. UC1225]SFN59543.1 Lysophospholipase L1 [Pseudobutyrivibrio sp. UC1225]
MDIRKFVRGLFQRKMVVLLVAIVLLFVVLFNSGMFGGKDIRVRITCAGDSLTYGSGVLKSREIDSYPSQLQVKLGTGYLVSNYGLRNATAASTGDLPYVESEQYKESLDSNPDIVILMLGTNDTKVDNWNPSDYREGLLSIVKTYQNLKSKPVVYLMRSPYCFPIEGNEHAEYQVQENIVNGELGDIISEVAAETGVTMIDLKAVTEGKEYLYTDGIHFTAEGYDLISDTVYDEIKKEVKEEK